MTRNRAWTVCAPVIPVWLAVAACSTIRSGGAGDPDDPNRVEITRCRVESTASLTLATARDLAGEYRLYMTSASSPELASGWLELTGAPPPSSSAHPVLVGTADVDAGRVGATVPGDPGSNETGAPGAALYLFADPASDGALRAVIRLGSESNRTDRQRFDGAHTTLTLTSVREDRFGGVWSSAVFGSETGGEFCAVRA